MDKLILLVFFAVLATALAAPAENVEESDLVAPEKEDLKTAASHWGGLGHYGGHWGGYYPHYGGYGGYGGYWGWPSYGYGYGYGWPYGGYGHYGHHGYWW